MTTTLVIGDLHVLSDADPRPSRALVRLLEAEPDAPVIFAGDTLDLAAERAATAEAAATRALQSAPELVAELRSRASRGVTTTFLAGNHDAEIATAGVDDAIHRVLSLDAEHRMHVRTEPWFARLVRGERVVHVEHGHVFDPDGAPTHPLAPSPRDDLGIRLLRRFIVPVGAHELVHANAEAPLALLTRVVRKYGPRAPEVVARYVLTAASTVRDSGRRFPLAGDRAAGAALLDAFAAGARLDAETLTLLLEAHATPTMACATSTFFRLYLDRVGATAGVTTGALMFALSPVTPIGAAGLSIAASSALVLAASIIAGANRYRGRAERALADGAARIADITAASTVILGHVHVDAEGPRYRNTASFAFARGARPYLRVEDDGVVTRAFAADAA
jgi:predicted phosphodiesterase